MTRFAFNILSHGIAWAAVVYLLVAFVEGRTDWLTYATQADRADAAMWWLIATTGSAAFVEVMG